MFKSRFTDRKLVLLLLLTLFIRLIILKEVWVEQYYSSGIYPFFSAFLRAILGWIPFSVGDLLYIAAGLWLIVKIRKLVKQIRAKSLSGFLSWGVVRKYLRLALVIYIVFNLFWGLNYYRQGISHQLRIELKPYTVEDLHELTVALEAKLNYYGAVIDSTKRSLYNAEDVLFDSSKVVYKKAELSHNFLRYTPASQKASLFTFIGKYIGFTGYYNPFSGEAQLKTSIPVFLKPFVITHEIAHQLGYAKENEASFVGYLACKSSGNADFLYSAYFDVYRDALFDCIQTGDTLFVNELKKNLVPRVKSDLTELRGYLLREKNVLEPFMSGAYDKYLKLNNQPKGKATYNEVVAYLVAYMKKFGRNAI